MNYYAPLQPEHAAGWTEERIKVLTELWMKGYSASQCAVELGGGVTRAAIIGKVHRLKLSRSTGARVLSQAHKAALHAGLSKAIGKPQGHGNKGRLSSQAIRRMQTAVREAPPPPLKVEPLPPDDLPDITPMLGVSFMQTIESKGCQWHDSDPMKVPNGFCGKPRKGQSHWCAEHYARVYPNGGVPV